MLRLGRERVVGSGGKRLECIRLLLLSPRIVGAGLHRHLWLLWLLLLLLLLLRQTSTSIRVVGLERRLLWRKASLLAQEGLRAKLIENTRLGGKPVGEAILVASLLRLLLVASGLRVLIVQEAGLLLLLLQRITKPVDRRLLLVALVVAGGLRLGWGRSIVKE